MNPIDDRPTSPGVTIRIAFDGAAYAGKTTALRALSESLGEAAISNEETDDGRTLWFDWMSHSGGLHNGKTIRAELVTVPGQMDLSARRRQLIEWCDVVVFLIDSQPEAIAESLTKFSALRSDMASLGDRPMVVLANKRDVPGAVAVEDLRSRLGMGPEDVIVETVATTGGGIRQAFIFAVRAALRNDPTRTTPTDPDELRASLPAALAPANDQPTPSAPAATSTPTPSAPAATSAPTPVQEPEPATAVARRLDNVQLNVPEGMGDTPFLLDAPTWRTVLDVARRPTSLPLDGTSPEARITRRLLEAQLIKGDVVTPIVAEVHRPAPTAVGASATESDHHPRRAHMLARRASPTTRSVKRRPKLSERDVERHRALLELRRNIRGY